MVMRTMRENTKWIMLLLTVAFVGWLVFDWVQSGTGQGAAANPTVAVINGDEIRYSRWSEHLQTQLDQARQQMQGALSDEQRHQVEEQAWERLINQVLIQQELERLDLEASEAEIRQAFRTSPPPSLRNRPEFQTDGEFDYRKYRQFFASGNVSRSLLMRIENYYRETIPRMKLQQLVAAEISVTPEDIWRAYRDRNATARVRFVAPAPDRLVPDSALEASAEAVQRYYREHEEEFTRPARAVVDVVSLDARPSSSDSARARARVDSLLGVVRAGDRSFSDLVDELTRSQRTGLRAAQVGPVSPDRLTRTLAEAVTSAPVGETTGPVQTSSGLHLVRVSEREADQVSFSQVVVPVQLSMASEDELFARMDTLEGIALRSSLEAAADSLGLPIRRDVQLGEGAEFVPGAGNLGVAVSWAFAPDTPEGALSQFFENASGFHILELHERLPAGMQELEEVEGEIRRRLRARARVDSVRNRLEAEVERMRRQGLTLESVASERGWEVRTSDRFSRTDRVPGLGRRTPAVGAAFGLEPGQIAGPFRAGDGRFAIIELLDRSEPERQAFEQARAQLRVQLQQQLRQQQVQQWIQALREEAAIQDLRDALGTGNQQGQGRPATGL